MRSVELGVLGDDDLYEQAPCGYLTTDPDGVVVRVNRTFLTWTGLERDAVEGLPLQRLLTAGGRIFYETHCAPMLRMQGMVREIALDVRCADGHRLPVLMNAVLHKTPAGEPASVRMTVLDATERRRYERELMVARDAEREARRHAEELQARLQELNAELERLAYVDVLTGAENRRALEQHLRRAVARARRRGGEFGVALVDVDHFKRVNDTHGHEAGDAVLRVLAERIRDCVRQEDVVGRWGGEEFLLFTPDTGPDGLATLCERVRRVIGAAPVHHRGVAIPVTASIGWATWPDESVESLVRRADDALYAAKRQGRDRVMRPAG